MQCSTIVFVNCFETCPFEKISGSNASSGGRTTLLAGAAEEGSGSMLSEVFVRGGGEANTL